MRRNNTRCGARILAALSFGTTARAQAPVQTAPPTTVVPVPAAEQAPTTPEPPKSAEVPVLGKWAPKFYGFVQLDVAEDSTQSFNDQAGNNAIARPGTYAGEHARLTMAVPNTRFGFKFKSPGEGDVHLSAVLEFDLLGPYATGTSEGNVFNNSFVRVRHAWFKFETPIVDVLLGQAWQLFGWQPYFHPATVEIQGVPGEIYSRTPQIRFSHTFKSEAIDVDVAAAAARPPQRDAALPDTQAGIKLSVNGWKGVRTMGATNTAADPFAVGVSGALRWFKVAEFAAKPTKDVTDTGWAISVDMFMPILPATFEDRGNALSFSGSFSDGAADADFYTGLNGGIAFPALPNPTGMMPPPTYTADADNGLVDFTPNGDLRTIQWWSCIVGVQYYLPPSGRLWLSGNYSHMHSSNIAEIGVPAAVFQTSNWFDANLFWDATAASRLGVEYAWFQQRYGDGVKAINSRFQFSGYFMF